MSKIKIGNVKGQDGFSPTVKENQNNTNDDYRLDITDKNGTFTTPNLKADNNYIAKTYATKIQVDEINSNLDTLEYSDVAGGKNLFNKNDVYDGYIDSTTGLPNGVTTYSQVVTGEIEIEPNETYFKNKNNTSDFRYSLFNQNHELIGVYHTTTGIITTTSDSKYIRLCLSKYDLDSYQFEKGSIETPYEPYIPSVKMLAEKTTQIDDLNVLGWVVPEEMPIKNYVDSDGVFHQRVDRVNLGDFYWDLHPTISGLFSTSTSFNLIKAPSSDNEIPNAYCSKYELHRYIDIELYDKNISVNAFGVIRIEDNSYTDATAFKNAMKGVYLYYELATEKTINVDGNEAVTKVNDSLEVIGKCKNLLKPTLATTTTNGVTCTANGDGTYTVNTPNGAATAKTQFIVYDKETTKYVGKKIIICGCPAGGDLSTYSISFTGWTPQQYFDTGNGYMIEFPSDVIGLRFNIDIGEGVTVNNLVFKPMIVDAEKFPDTTYDDFVPYTGDGDTLMEDVASIKNDLSTHTHNYAGSSSVGGSANSAVKLDTTSAGSASQPVYFSDGKPVAGDFVCEKGTWTPATNMISGADVTIQSADYILVGKIVYLHATFIVNSSGNYVLYTSSGVPIRVSTVLSACSFDVDTSGDHLLATYVRDSVIYFNLNEGVKRISIVYTTE